MKKVEHLTLLPLFEELRGERVVVRPYRPEDAEALHEAVVESRDHLRPWMPWADSHQTIEESRDWLVRAIAKHMTREEIALPIWEIKTGRLLGGTGLHPRNWEIRSFEIGYWLRKSAEGKGYATEAVRLLVQFALEELKANRVEIRCDERNTHSAAVARRLGFKQEALLRNHMTAPDGALRNTLIFSRIPGD
jgi:RimJ/RimL family protein N-acetyltransferase